MSAQTVAGLFLIVLPVAFNVAFGLLAARFDYPDVLRRPTGEVLERFPEGASHCWPRGARPAPPRRAPARPTYSRRGSSSA